MRLRPLAVLTVTLLSGVGVQFGAAQTPESVSRAVGQQPAKPGDGQTETARSWLYLREPLARDLARFLRSHVAEVKARAIRDPGKMFDPEPFDRLVFAGEPRAVRAVEDFTKLFQDPPALGSMMTAMIEESLLAQGREKEVLEGRARIEAERKPVEVIYRLTPGRTHAVASLIRRHALVPIRVRAEEGELLVACSPEDHRKLAPMLTLLEAKRLDGKPDGG